MLNIQDGQCGTCAHFGGDHADEPKLVQIRISHQAERDLVEPCGHPKNEPQHLKVSPVSTCDGYEPAAVA